MLPLMFWFLLHRLCCHGWHHSKLLVTSISNIASSLHSHASCYQGFYFLSAKYWLYTMFTITIGYTQCLPVTIGYTQCLLLEYFPQAGYIRNSIWFQLSTIIYLSVSNIIWINAFSMTLAFSREELNSKSKKLRNNKRINNIAKKKHHLLQYSFTSFFFEYWRNSVVLCGESFV